MVSTAHCCPAPSELAARGGCRRRRPTTALLRQAWRPWQRFTRLRLAGRAGIARSLAGEAL